MVLRTLFYLLLPKLTCEPFVTGFKKFNVLSDGASVKFGAIIDLTHRVLFPSSMKRDNAFKQV